MALGGNVGDITYHRIIEMEGPEFVVGDFLPDATEEKLKPYLDWLQPRFIDPASGKLMLTMQSYVLRTQHHTILVDSCVGNHKPRGFVDSWNMRDSMVYLDALAGAGLRPEDIDYVMCTHMHIDHVGWNTRLIDGRWVPTFPNARYLFSKTEFDFWTEHFERNPKTGHGCIGDSVMPVVEAGLADIVADDFALGDHITLKMMPGHSPGHVAINLASAGEKAVLSGDILHSPLHCREPSWSSIGCADRAQSAQTRRAFLEQHCDTGTLIMTAHFPSPSVGHITRHGDAFDFVFHGED